MKIEWSKKELEFKKNDYREKAEQLKEILLTNFSYIEDYVRNGVGISILNNILIETKVPAVVVGLGPSLDSHLDLLKENQDRLFIIAGDAVVPILHSNGIHPHIIVVCDHSDRQVKNFEGLDVSDSLVFASSGVNPMTFNAMRKANARILWYHLYGEDYVSSFIVKRGGRKGALLPGVLTSAIAFQAAIWLGFRTVGFIGNDLAFYDLNSGYASGTNQEKVQFQIDSKFKSGLAMFPDIHGNPVLTSDVFIAFYNWMNVEDEIWKWHGVDVYNCSERGILHGDRITQVTFKTFIDKFGQQKSLMDILNYRYSQELITYDLVIGDVPKEPAKKEGELASVEEILDISSEEGGF